MAKGKLRRYKEVQQFENVTDLSDIRPGDQVSLQGRWSSEIFGNDHPIILELACGKGDYALAMARQHPERNYIGVDIKGERIWQGAREALEENIENIHFIRARIDHLTQIFGKGEIDEIWITFPDPFLKFRRRTRRLTHPRFIDRYREVLNNGGPVHLKTDSPELYRFTLTVIEELQLEIVKQRDNVYAQAPVPDLLQVQTYYEKKHLREGRTIRYISFRV